MTELFQFGEEFPRHDGPTAPLKALRIGPDLPLLPVHRWEYDSFVTFCAVAREGWF